MSVIQGINGISGLLVSEVVHGVRGSKRVCDVSESKVVSGVQIIQGMSGL